MTMYDNSYPRSSSTDSPFNAAQHRRYDETVLGKQGLVVNPYGSDHAAKAAHAAVRLAFGRHARALHQTNFQDREPWQMPARAPGAGLTK